MYASVICLPIQSLDRPRAHIMDSVDRVLPDMLRQPHGYGHFEGVLFRRGKLVTEIHKLLCLYLTIPSTTSERAFSTLRRLLTYPQFTMTEKRLNMVTLTCAERVANLVDVAIDFTSLPTSK